MSARYDVIVASHLRWSFVWQRPQQVLSRIARRHRVLFIEEPIFPAQGDPQPFSPLQQACHNVWVLAPRVAAPERPGTPVWQDRASISLQVLEAMRTLQIGRRALWFYTPLPEFLLEVVRPDIVVYDVMDELANFKFAPPELKEQEARLLRRADVVFTGGASLYEAKQAFNPNTHLFASGVDTAHYSLACRPDTKVPAFVDDLPAPRAVYIGVIDERLDYPLIAHAAAARPHVQFLMVGPVVKVDPADLPKAPNLHYVGQQQYQDLPRILKGCDLCLMPFARNEATRFISPTKTLEYMATHRPIVSTPIRDVERFYSDIVYLASGPEEFVRQMDAALNESASERARRNVREERILAEHAWDAIAANMERIMDQAFDARLARIRPPVVAPTARYAPATARIATEA